MCVENLLWFSFTFHWLFVDHRDIPKGERADKSWKAWRLNESKPRFMKCAGWTGKALVCFLEQFKCLNVVEVNYVFFWIEKKYRKTWKCKIWRLVWSWNERELYTSAMDDAREWSFIESSGLYVTCLLRLERCNIARRKLVRDSMCTFLICFLILKITDLKLKIHWP